MRRQHQLKQFARTIKEKKDSIITPEENERIIQEIAEQIHAGTFEYDVKMSKYTMAQVMMAYFRK